MSATAWPHGVETNVRRRSLAWWRGSPAKPGMTVRDREGAYVGRVVAVSLGAEGEVDTLDVDVLCSVMPPCRKRLQADQARIAGHEVIALLYRRQIALLPDVRVGRA